MSRSSSGRRFVSEWWTYRLSSFLLFSPRTWFRLHEIYNTEIWPAQVVALALGATIFVLAWQGGLRGGRIAALLLAACWLWVAWSFHLRRYATINFAATWYAAAFAIEALLLAWFGGVRGRMGFALDGRFLTRAGTWLLLFALVGQPLLGPLAGRSFTQSEYFGVAPDPTVAATLGVILLAPRRSIVLMAIPLSWCVIAGAFQWAMRTPDALVMPLVAVLTIAAMALTRWHRAAPGMKERA